jgi:hypothetical protein
LSHESHSNFSNQIPEFSGYGNLAPKTDWWKIVTIFYAILGIPLMLLCLSHIGDFMANAFRILYWKVTLELMQEDMAQF